MSNNAGGVVDRFVDRVQASRLVPVLRASSGDYLVDVARSLVSGGIEVVELTTNTPGAFRALEILKAEWLNEGALIGMGTVTSAEEAQRAFDMGADFIVTPVLRADAARVAVERGRPVVIGALTPSEVLDASEMSAAIVKIFPGGPLGPSYLRALRDVFPQVKIMPTGGITQQTAVEFLHAGALAVGIGGPLLEGALQGEGIDQVADRAAKLLQELNGACTQAGG